MNINLYDIFVYKHFDTISYINTYIWGGTENFSNRSTRQKQMTRHEIFLKIPSWLGWKFFSIPYIFIIGSTSYYTVL